MPRTLAPRVKPLASWNGRSGCGSAPPTSLLGTRIANRKSAIVNARLALITDWPERTHKAKYSVQALAKLCKISVRTLERFFAVAMGESPNCWIKELRMKKAVEALTGWLTVKETAAYLGYGHATHFSRDFKKYWGLSPSAKFLLLSGGQGGLLS